MRSDFCWSAKVRAGARYGGIGIGLLKSGMNALVQQDIRGVVEVAHDAGAIVKVILETCLLTMEEKIRGSELGR